MQDEPKVQDRDRDAPKEIDDTTPNPKLKPPDFDSVSEDLGRKPTGHEIRLIIEDTDSGKKQD